MAAMEEELSIIKHEMKTWFCFSRSQRNPGFKLQFALVVHLHALCIKHPHRPYHHPLKKGHSCFIYNSHVSLSTSLHIHSWSSLHLHKLFEYWSGISFQTSGCPFVAEAVLKLQTWLLNRVQGRHWASLSHRKWCMACHVKHVCYSDAWTGL